MKRDDVALKINRFC